MEMNSNQDLFLNRASRICGIISAGIGCLGLAGWALGLRVLTGVRTEYIPMAPNTALIIILLGFSLYALTVWPGHRTLRVAITGLMVFCILVAGLTLISFLTGIDTRIDNLLLIPVGTVGFVPVGHMSFVTATCFLLGIFAILLLMQEKKSPAAFLSTWIVGIAGIIIIGYWYGAPPLYGGTIVPVAFTTAVALGVLGIGVIFAAGTASWPLSRITGSSTRSYLLRGLLPVILIIVITVNWINAVIIRTIDSTIVLLSAVTAIVSLFVVYLVISYLSRKIGDTIDRYERERIQAEIAQRQKNSDLETAYELITAREEELKANFDKLINSQRALEESERKYRNLYQLAQVGLFETSFKDATIVACNQRYALLAGFSSIQEAIGKDIIHLYVNPDDRKEVGRILRDQGSVENYTVKLRNQATGKIFWGQFSARYNFAQDLAEGSIVDISAQKSAEDALRESEKRLRDAQEMAHLGFWFWDIKTGSVEWSEELFKIFGLDPKEFIPHIESILALSPWPEDHRRNEELIRRATESHEAGTYEQRFVRPDKSVGYYHSTFQGRYDDGGNLTLIVGTVLDITERKLTEVQRERLIAELEQKNAELERYTYTVSHDLKSPLITIKGFAGLIEDDVSKGDTLQLKKDILRITTAVDTMQSLLVDLIELSRVGKIINPPQTIPFGTIAHEAVDLLAIPLAEHGVTVTIAPELPYVYVDHARIREVMINLIENAAKFLGDQLYPKIRIGADMTGKTPVFFVQDNGIGIDPRYLERIFNLFERLDASAPGTGIGLTISRRIIEVHGGKIWAESEGVGKGTTFRFTLPGTVVQ